MGSREKTECMYRGQLSNADPSPKRESPQHKKEDIPPLVRQVVSCPVVTMTMHDCHTSKFSSLLVQAIQKDCNPHTYKGRLCSSWMPAGIDDQPKRQVYGTFKYGTVSSHNDGCGDILSSTLPPSMLSTASEPSDDIKKKLSHMADFLVYNCQDSPLESTIAHSFRMSIQRSTWGAPIDYGFFDSQRSGGVSSSAQCNATISPWRI